MTSAMPGRGPQLRPVAVRLGSLEKQLQQATALAGAQLQRASRREAHPQSVGSPSASCPQPAQDGTGGALDAAPHFVQRQARVPQGQRPPATVLEQIGTSLQSGHTCSLLKGIVLHYLYRSQIELDSRTRYYAVFAQDAFKIRPNLTLNYGVRWEVNQPWYDTQGKIEQFVPGQQSRVFPDAPRVWVFPGGPGISNTLAKPPYDRFAPRLGIAYSPEFSRGILGTIFGGPGKTSIRAAYGLYYTAVEDLTLFGEI